MCKKCVKFPYMGDLVFTRSNSLISKAIRTITGGQYSHVAVYFKDNLILESDWGGVALTSLKKYPDHKIVSISNGKVDRYLFMNTLFTKIGDGYDYSLLFGNLLYRLLGHAKWTLGIADSPNKWMCSEVVAKSLVEAGEKFDVEINSIDPEYLRSFYESLGEKNG